MALHTTFGESKTSIAGTGIAFSPVQCHSTRQRKSNTESDKAFRATILARTNQVLEIRGCFFPLLLLRHLHEWSGGGGGCGSFGDGSGLYVGISLPDVRIEVDTIPRSDAHLGGICIRLRTSNCKRRDTT